MENETQESVIEALETEFKSFNSDRANWLSIYQMLRKKCETYDKEYTSEEFKKPENKHLNRYKDVAPYDHTRVILNKGSCDYINANIVEVKQAGRKYILTQGPLSQTSGHFWLMAWEQRSKAIIMLNKVMEKNQIKCHQYWPLEGSSSHSMMFPDVGIKVEYVTKMDKADYSIRTLRLTDVETKESRDILHFHYTTWPDFGIPKSPMAFLAFLKDVRQSGALNQNAGPSIVHCSAGIGRSGTFCVVDTCLLLLENGYNNVSIQEILLEMRKFRMGLIQTPDQLKFSYMAIIEGYRNMPDNNNVNGDDSTDEDESPPVIPPRGESLKPRLSTVDTNTINNESNANSPPDKPLPHEPLVKNDTCNANNVSNNHMHSGSDDDDTYQSARSPSSSSETKLRQRKKNDRLAEQVRDIKRRQKESEEWQNLKRSLFSPLSLGIAAIAGGGALAICAYLYKYIVRGG